MSKILPVPAKPANTSPEYYQQWLDYWESVKAYRAPSNKEYQKAYQDNKTRLRRIAKLHELMDKYQDEAKAHVYKPVTGSQAHAKVDSSI